MPYWTPKYTADSPDWDDGKLPIHDVLDDRDEDVSEEGKAERPCRERIDPDDDFEPAETELVVDAVLRMQVTSDLSALDIYQ
jgi:hypothetical protein